MQEENKEQANEERTPVELNEQGHLSHRLRKQGSPNRNRLE